MQIDAIYNPWFIANPSGDREARQAMVKAPARIMAAKLFPTLSSAVGAGTQGHAGGGERRDFGGSQLCASVVSAAA